MPAGDGAGGPGLQAVRRMSRWWDSVRLGFTVSDRAWAAECLSLVRQRMGHERRGDRIANAFWSASESELFGLYGQAALSRHLAQELPSPTEYAMRGDRGTDFPDLDTEVKTVPWAALEHFHLCNGGRLVVRLRPSMPKLTALCTYFVRSDRVYLDGWATREMLQRAPRRRYSKVGLTAAEIQYQDLLPARAFHDRAA